MSLKRPHAHLHLPAILLAIPLLIGTVNCKSYGSIRNSSLNSQAIYRYSKEAALSRTNYQPKAQCLNKGSPCAETKDCCQTVDNQLLSCGYFGTATKTCQPCGLGNDNCDSSDTMCCPGFLCDSELGCVQDNTCIQENDVCSPPYSTCCNNLKCIVDSEGKSYCSSQCSEKAGQCEYPGSNVGCCTGYSCTANKICDCGSVNDYCIPGTNPKVCCGDYNCDGNSYSCQLCIASKDTCNAEGETRSCCSSIPCDPDTGKCCKISGNRCDPYDAEYTCCAGLKCLGDVDEETCQPFCINPGSECTSVDDKCCVSPQTCQNDNGMLTCKPPCINSGNLCTSSTDTCCDTTLTCDAGEGYCCKPSGDSCDADAANICCDGLNCQGDPGSLTCRTNCVTTGSSCTLGGDPCCNSALTCQGDQGSLTCRTNCVTAGGNCATSTDTCCNSALTCQGDQGSQTCRTKCVASDTTCMSATDECCDSSKSCQDDNGVLKCKPRCISYDGVCSSSTDTCCDSTQTCTETSSPPQPTKSSFICKSECSEAGQYCKNVGWGKDHGWGWGPVSSSTCCSPFTCDVNTHKCCAPVGITCGNGGSCCSGLECESSTCKEKPCITRGNYCDTNNFCCAGLACDPSTKKCMGGTGGHCDNTILCSSDHECNPATSSCYPTWCVGVSSLPKICLPQPFVGVFYPPINEP